MVQGQSVIQHSKIHIYKQHGVWGVRTSNEFNILDCKDLAKLNAACKFCADMQGKMLKEAGITVKKIANSGRNARYSVMRGKQFLLTFNAKAGTTELGLLQNAAFLLTKKGLI